MSRTQTLRRQHDTLVELVRQLRETMLAIDTIDQAMACARLLAKMTGILRVHLAAEDSSLYPRMIASTDSVASATARSFSEQMGGLAEVYLAYEANWRTGRAIIENLEHFRQETDMVLTALVDRIERENSVLYPLADGIDARSARNAA